jgi:hypothetical protein
MRDTVSDGGLSPLYRRTRHARRVLCVDGRRAAAPNKRNSPSPRPGLCRPWTAGPRPGSGTACGRRPPWSASSSSWWVVFVCFCCRAAAAAPTKKTKSADGRAALARFTLFIITEAARGRPNPKNGRVFQTTHTKHHTHVLHTHQWKPPSPAWLTWVRWRRAEGEREGREGGRTTRPSKRQHAFPSRNKKHGRRSHTIPTQPHTQQLPARSPWNARTTRKGELM